MPNVPTRTRKGGYIVLTVYWIVVLPFNLAFMFTLLFGGVDRSDH
jgi:hypothetical protein